MIDLTTNLRQPAELRAAAAYLEALAAIRDTQRPTSVGEVASAARIHPDDNPERGTPLPPIVPPPPVAPVAASLDPAAVFGHNPTSAVPQPPSVPLPPPVVPPVAALATGSTASGTAPAASAAPVQSGSVNAAGKQLDNRGLPHDGRIHSTPPTITDKGVWRKKRGLDDEALVKRIEAELLGVQAAPAPVVPVPPPPAPIVSAAGAAVGLPVPPAPVATDGPTTLPELMQRVAPLMATGATDLARINAACAAIGAANLAALGSRPDLVPAVWQRLTAAEPVAA